jgi:hypothetical protein
MYRNRSQIIIRGSSLFVLAFLMPFHCCAGEAEYVSLEPPVLLPNGNEFKTWSDQTVYAKTFYVDQSHPDASDENPGSRDKPFLTINKAAQVVGPGERVVVESGVYRELIEPRLGGRLSTCTKNVVLNNILINAKEGIWFIDDDNISDRNIFVDCGPPFDFAAWQKKGFDKNKEIQLVINTPIGKLSIYDDSYIRKTAIKYKIPYITTLAAAIAAAKGIAAYRKGKGSVRSLQSYHGDIH